MQKLWLPEELGQRRLMKQRLHCGSSKYMFAGLQKAANLSFYQKLQACSIQPLATLVI